MNRKVCSKQGRADALAETNKTPPQLVDELYLSALSRPPSISETRTALSAFGSRTRRQAVEDLLWALLNTGEFATIR